MNSLVVLLSVVAFAAAKPSGVLDAGLLAYSSPYIAAAPAAVSSQSRLDIKSSPAVVAHQIQPISRTVIAEPSYLAAPVAYAAAPAAVSHQSRLDIKSIPAITKTVVSAPVAYSAPIAAAEYAVPAAYAAPAVAYTGGSAVSHQSRFDIETSPAITKTVVSAPVAYSAPIVKAAYAAPVAYSAPVVAPAVTYTGGSAVSHQSRFDIETSPAITKTVFSAPVAYSAPIVKAAYAAPVAYSAPVVAPAVAYTGGSAVSTQSRFDIKSTPAISSTVVSAPVAYSAHIATAALAPAFVKTAFAAPAYIKSAALVPAAIGAPVVPLDTPEVIAARAAHFQAKAVAEGHLIKKRSVLATPIVSSPVISTYSAPIVSAYSSPVYSAQLAYSAPLAYSAYSTPIVTKAYGVHPW